MSAQGDKQRNRPDEDPSTRRTAEDELMRGDRGVGRTGGGGSGGSGTGGGGLENEGTGSLLVDLPDDAAPDRQGEGASGSTQGARAPGVSGKRGMPGGTENEGEGHSGPIRSGSGRQGAAPAKPDRAADDNENAEAGDNAREGYEDHGSSRDADGTQGESSGSRPGYH